MRTTTFEHSRYVITYRMDARPVPTDRYRPAVLDLRRGDARIVGEKRNNTLSA